MMDYERLSEPARRALMGTVLIVHHSNGPEVFQELRDRNMINPDGCLTWRGREARADLINAELDRDLPARAPAPDGPRTLTLPEVDSRAVALLGKRTGWRWERIDGPGWPRWAAEGGHFTHTLPFVLQCEGEVMEVFDE